VSFGSGGRLGGASAGRGGARRAVRSARATRQRRRGGEDRQRDDEDPRGLVRRLWGVEAWRSHLLVDSLWPRFGQGANHPEEPQPG
jgi:hypothetical protein